MSPTRPGERTPSTRERLKPWELLGFAGVLALFTGVVVIFTTREPILALVFFGVAFIVALVCLALFALTIKPNENPTGEGRDEADDGGSGGAGGGPDGSSGAR